MAIAENQWNPRSYARNAGFVASYGEELIAWIPDDVLAQPACRILDLGCGDGVLTLRLVEELAERRRAVASTAGLQPEEVTPLRVLGVDGSAAMVAAAQARGVEAIVADGEALPFTKEFALVFSNAALHWMRQPERVVAGVVRALLPGGWMVAEFGGYGNVAAICTAVRAALEENGVAERANFPWYFPSPAAYAKLLADHGLQVERMAHFPRPTPLPTGMRGWLETFAQSWLQALQEAEREAVLRRAEELLRPAMQDERGNWFADYFRLRISARLL